MISLRNTDLISCVLNILVYPSGTGKESRQLNAVLLSLSFVFVQANERDFKIAIVSLRSCEGVNTHLENI